jgi:hypothetical protein
VFRRVESRSFGGVREGRRQGVGLFYKRGAAAVPHGARTLPPWGTTLGLLAPWATTLEFLPPWPTPAGIWPHRAVQPTVGATPNAVPHLPPWGTTQMYISRNFWFDHLFYENQCKINIKNRTCCTHLRCRFCAPHTQLVGMHTNMETFITNPW